MINETLIQSGILGERWRKIKKEEEILIEEFWAWLYDQEYWEEFLAYLFKIPVSLLEGLLKGAYRSKKPRDLDIWVEGKTVNFRLRKDFPKDERGDYVHDYWAEYYPIEDLENLNEVGKAYLLEGQDDYLKEKISELEAIKADYLLRADEINEKIKEYEKEMLLRPLGEENESR